MCQLMVIVSGHRRQWTLSRGSLSTGCKLFFVTKLIAKNYLVVNFSYYPNERLIKKPYPLLIRLRSPVTV